MKCPICGGAELVDDARDVPYIYKRESTMLPAVTGDFCPACGEIIPDSNESGRISALMREFSKQVNASLSILDSLRTLAKNSILTSVKQSRYLEGA